MAHKKRLPKAYLDLPIQGKLGAWDVRNELVTAGDVSSVMTVDPGLSGTGVAVFPLLSLREGVESLPEFTECITDSSIQTWDTRGEHILSRFAFLLNVYNPEHLVIEGVKYFVGSARSQAATTKGDLFKLAWLIGGLAHTANSIDYPPFIDYVLPDEWKAQMDKEALTLRIKRAIGKIYPNHIADAVGLGLWIVDKL